MVVPSERSERGMGLRGERLMKLSRKSPLRLLGLKMFEV